MSLAPYLIKILLYALVDLLCLAWAIGGSQPLHWIAVAFALIAAFYALTKRYDIARNCTRAIRRFNCYPVVLSECVPQTSRPSAHGTSILKIFHALLPIICRKVNWEVEFSSIPTDIM